MQWRSALLYYHKTFFSAYAKVPYAEVERPCILVVCGLSQQEVEKMSNEIVLIKKSRFFL